MRPARRVFVQQQAVSGARRIREGPYERRAGSCRRQLLNRVGGRIGGSRRGRDSSGVLCEALIHLQQTLVLRCVGKDLAPCRSERQRIAECSRAGRARCAQRFGQCTPLQLHPVAAVHRVQVVELAVADLESELRLDAVEQFVHHEPAARVRVGRKHLPDQRAPARAAPLRRRICESQHGWLLGVRRRLAGGNRVSRRIGNHHGPA